jgi:gliding motility-associated-like protein
MRLSLWCGLLFSSIISTCGVQVSAQDYAKKENHIWISQSDGLDNNPLFPNPIFPGTGINFNNSPITQIDAAGTYGVYTGIMSTGTASIADKNGKLLFYTNGNIVWDKDNNVMDNGWGINDNGAPPYYLQQGTWGTTESSFSFDGVAIVPMPGHSSKYYIFCIMNVLIPDNFMGGYSGPGEWEGKLRYTVVDMDGNGGLGSVDENEHGIVVADSMSGNLHVVRGEDCNYWVVGNYSMGGFHAFNVTTEGVDTNPVVSVVVPPLQPYCYELNISPLRNRLAEAFDGEVELCHFDPASGMVSDYAPNPILIGAQKAHSIAFSPDNNKLYVGGLIGIRQYELSGPLPIFNSPPLSIDNTVYEFYGPLRLGPDGKIYFNYAGNAYNVGWAIHQPNLAGTACEIDSIQNVPLMLKRTMWFIPQFPNEVAVNTYDTVDSKLQAPLCFDSNSLWLKPLPATATGTDYRWKIKNGATYWSIGSDTSSLRVSQTGTYTVQYFTNNTCELHRDTFQVDRVVFSLSLLRNDPQTASCDGSAVTLKPFTDAQNAAYSWQDGSTGNTITADTSGLYYVSVSSQGCTLSDSIHIQISDVQQNLGNDTFLCLENKNAFLKVIAQVPSGASALWNTGSTQNDIVVTDSGWYAVTVTAGACKGVDSIHVDQLYCECPMLIPNAFSPNNDGLNDYFIPALPGNCAVDEFALEIYNRWGQRIFTSYKRDKGWDGTYNGHAADMGSYRYRIRMLLGVHKKEVTQNGDFMLIR